MEAKNFYGKFAGLIRERIFLVGLLCVFLPLLSLLLVQFQSLSLMQRKSVQANNLLLQSCLESVAAETNYIYRLESEKILNLPVSALKDENSAAAHFERHKWNGAQVYFTYSNDGKAIRFFPTQIDANLSDAVKRAFYGRENEANLNNLTVVESDPNRRFIFKFLADNNGNTAGAVGFVLNNDFFVKEILPSIVKEKRAAFFPGEYGETVIVTVLDGKNRLISADQPVSGIDENVSVPLRFVFMDWHLQAQNTVVSQSDWSRKIFRNNILISCLLAAFLALALIIALRAANRQMKLSQIKSDFVANISHELRTPLTSIRVFGELLSAGWIKDEEKLRETGTQIESETRRLTYLIDNLLDYSQIEAGKKQYHFERGDLRETIAATIQSLEPQLSRKGYQLDFEADKESSAEISFDREGVRQVLINLIDNAVKYSPENKRILISFSENYGKAVIRVRDWGIGIPQSEQKKIFEKFHRIGNNLTHDVKGSGLGLAIVSQIVAAHHGRIEVKSSPHKGSTFSIYLPAGKNGNGR
ncbi:MAG: hypothetical protein JSS81_29955 [Acidobacteria bacterium]|nr:hypothetical protein [Acidobacteriota bacterium]